MKTWCIVKTGNQAMIKSWLEILVRDKFNIYTLLERVCHTNKAGGQAMNMLLKPVMKLTIQFCVTWAHSFHRIFIKYQVFN